MIHRFSSTRTLNLLTLTLLGGLLGSGCVVTSSDNDDDFDFDDDDTSGEDAGADDDDADDDDDRGDAGADDDDTYSDDTADDDTSDAPWGDAGAPEPDPDSGTEPPSDDAGTDVDWDEDGQTVADGDCDDRDPNVNRWAVEVCGDNIDNDCDGETDGTCEWDTGDDDVEGDAGAGEERLELVVRPEENVSLDFTVNLPNPETGEVGGDVMFVFDRSGSFDDDLETFQEQAVDIVTTLNERIADLRVGLSSFVDAPCSDFGSGTDFGYSLNLNLNGEAPESPITVSEVSDDPLVQNFHAALQRLDIRDGGDFPESQLEAMFQAMTGAGFTVPADSECSPGADIAPSDPDWDEERIPFLIVSTDATFHDPSDEGFGASYPYPTDVQRVIDTAEESGTTIFFLNSGTDTDSRAAEIAEATGGGVHTLGTASEEVVAAINDAIGGSISNIEVRMVPTEEGDEFVESIEPEVVVADLTEDRVATFTVTFTAAVEQTDEPQDFDFDLVVNAGGAEIERTLVTVVVPAADAEEE